MTRMSWIVGVGAITGAVGAEAIPAGESLEVSLLKAAAGSGLIGLMLLWFVFQSRKDRELEREDRRQERAEAAKREAHLAERLNHVEDGLIETVTESINENTKALNTFTEIARDCHNRNMERN